MSMRPFAFGAAVGLGLSALCFFTVPAYHDYLVWAWSTPALWLIGIPVGAALAVATD